MASSCKATLQIFVLEPVPYKPREPKRDLLHPNTHTVEPRYNEVPRYRKKMFVIAGSSL